MWMVWWQSCWCGLKYVFSRQDRQTWHCISPSPPCPARLNHSNLLFNAIDLHLIVLYIQKIEDRSPAQHSTGLLDNWKRLACMPAWFGWSVPALFSPCTSV
mmetsp:Transcript_13828/g.22846  ORF Transcript_13828/g.22846 Transcript_13828/m.22846 type:complete len:101 (-) Transcript_13828:270-572(-)